MSPTRHNNFFLPFFAFLCRGSSGQITKVRVVDMQVRQLVNSSSTKETDIDASTEFRANADMSSRNNG